MFLAQASERNAIRGKAFMKWGLPFLVFLLVLIIDQFTKYIVTQSLMLGEPVSVLPGFFNLTLVYNPGAAFGMFRGYPDAVRRTMLCVVSVIALIVVIRFMLHEAKEDRVSQYALIGILAGAAGNIMDRIRFGAVVDFLDFYWRHYHWPAFNVADSCISVAVGLLVLDLYLEGRKKA